MFDDVTNGMCVDSPIGERIRSWRKNRKVNNMKMAEQMMNNQTVFLLIIARDKIFYFLLILSYFGDAFNSASTLSFLALSSGERYFFPLKYFFSFSNSSFLLFI